MPTTDCATAPVSTAAGGVWQFLRRVGGFLARVVLSAPRQALRLAPGRGERGPRSTADAGREANQGQAREKPDEAMQARQASSPKSSRRLAVGPKLDVSVEGLIGRGAAGKVFKDTLFHFPFPHSLSPTTNSLCPSLSLSFWRHT